MKTGKMIDPSAHIGDAGVALIHQRVSAMGHVWHPRQLDAGIDGTIELRDLGSGVVSNRHILVQSKASNRLFPGENPNRFHFICDGRDLDYWMQANLPVVLVCSHPVNQEAWWVHIQGYFGDPVRRAARRIDFDKATMAFDDSVSDRLLAVADPHGRAHTPAAEERPEVLDSNLLPVQFPETYWSYGTRITRSEDVYTIQHQSGLPIRDDFIVASGRLFAWAPVEETALRGAIGSKAVVEETAELMSGGAESQWRRLVQMLNAALRHDVRQDCAWHRDRRMLYFRATPDMQPRHVNTSGPHWRAVFKGYPTPSDQARIGYYRHAGLRWQFMFLDGSCICALSPDYYFSHDGIGESGSSARLLRGIKGLERNPAVRGETRMWAAFLRAEPDRPGRLLRFGELLAFPVPFGIDDAAWRKDALSAAQPDIDPAILGESA